MDLLIVESLDDRLMGRLRRRYTLRHAPELALDRRAFLHALGDVRSIIVPASVTIDESTLQHAPRLRAVGRIAAGAERIDHAACRRAGVEVVRSVDGTAKAEAEFMIGALLSLLRRVPVPAPGGMRLGRELGAATVGLIGLAPAAREMARMLSAFGPMLVGHDPAVHATDSVWARWKVQPLGLREVFERSDAVCVQLGAYHRYRGLLGAEVLPFCKPNQVLISIGPSALFDAQALAEALASGRIVAAWLDSVGPGDLRPGQPLHGHDNLQITPRVASTTVESRRRCAWAVVKRIDEVLSQEPAPAPAAFRTTWPDDSADPGAGRPWP